jgi:myo-inositol-1(or 4)-monophosphatase
VASVPPASVSPLSNADAAEYAAFALDAAIAAGAAILPHFRAPLDVEDKGGARGYDPVTEADRAAEAVIREAITGRYPDHGIHGEEHGRVHGQSPLTWVVDPIDGTRSFIVGHLHWGTLIALFDGERPRVGVTHQPFVGESFIAVNGASHWQRGGERRVLRTRRCPSIGDAVVVTTDPRHFKSDRQRHAYAAATDGARLVRYGGDCYCYTPVAMGLVDIVIETGLQAYDIQALIPLIEYAGGVVTNWAGGPCYDGGDVLACGDPALHAEVLRRMGAR